MGLLYVNENGAQIGYEANKCVVNYKDGLKKLIPIETPYTAKTRFPSPTEDLYFSMVTQTIVVTVQIVSVPYRGLIFLN